MSCLLQEYAHASMSREAVRSLRVIGQRAGRGGVALGVWGGATDRTTRLLVGWWESSGLWPQAARAGATST